MKVRRETEEGQAVIEFVLALVFLMAFMAFFVKLALMFALGNFAQYATYIGSRAYLSAGKTQDDQTQRAQEYMTYLLAKNPESPGAPRFPAAGIGQGGGTPSGATIGTGSFFRADDRDFSWQEGVRYEFRSRLPMMLLSDRNDDLVTLVSESWLGREPTFDECWQDIETRVGATFVDNGC